MRPLKGDAWQFLIVSQKSERDWNFKLSILVIHFFILVFALTISEVGWLLISCLIWLPLFSLVLHILWRTVKISTPLCHFHPQIPHTSTLKVTKLSFTIGDSSRFWGNFKNKCVHFINRDRDCHLRSEKIPLNQRRKIFSSGRYHW